MLQKIWVCREKFFSPKRYTDRNFFGDGWGVTENDFPEKKFQVTFANIPPGASSSRRHCLYNSTWLINIKVCDMKGFKVECCFHPWLYFIYYSVVVYIVVRLPGGDGVRMIEADFCKCLNLVLYTYNHSYYVYHV